MALAINIYYTSFKIKKIFIYYYSKEKNKNYIFSKQLLYTKKN